MAGLPDRRQQLGILLNRSQLPDDMKRKRQKTEFEQLLSLVALTTR